MPASISVRQRVIDHRLVVDRQQLLADDARERIEPRAGAAGEDDPLHGKTMNYEPDCLYSGTLNATGS